MWAIPPSFCNRITHTHLHIESDVKWSGLSVDGSVVESDEDDGDDGDDGGDGDGLSAEEKNEMKLCVFNVAILQQNYICDVSAKYVLALPGIWPMTFSLMKKSFFSFG